MSYTRQKFQCSSHVGFLLIFFYLEKFQQLQTTSNCVVLFIGSRYSTRSFAKKSLKKPRKDGSEAFGELSDDKIGQIDKLDTSFNPSSQNSNPVPSKSAVLQACIITSGLIAALGIVIRQVCFLFCIATSLPPFVPFSQFDYLF